MPNDLDPTASLLETALPFLEYGALGAGFLLLILCGIIIMRNKPAADEGLAIFRQRFLYTGITLAILGVATNMYQMFSTQQKREGTHALTVTFKPDIAYRNLPDPKLTLLPSTGFAEHQEIKIAKDSVLSIGLDAILDYSSQIEKERAQLAKAVTNLNKAYATTDFSARENDAGMRTLSANIDRAIENKDTGTVLRNSEILLNTTTDIRRPPNPN